MFEAFPDNYVWNLAAIGEIDEANRKVLTAAADGDSGTTAFFESWCQLADGLVDQADTDVRRGHPFSAGVRYSRACAHYLTAERMQARNFTPRREACAKFLSAFAKTTKFLDPHCEPVSYPISKLPRSDRHGRQDAQDLRGVGLQRRTLQRRQYRSRTQLHSGLDRDDLQRSVDGT
jgi:hypothetical protein